MRWKITLCALGAAAGLAVIAALWKAGVAQPSNADSEPRGTMARTSTNERIGVPVAVADETAPAPETAGHLLRAAVAGLPALSVEGRDRVVRELVVKLRAHGQDGLKVVREFFAASGDVKLRNGFEMADGKIKSAPSLRIALLEALSDWPGAVEVNREIARSTSRGFEAAIAIRNLEKSAPGVHRAEAIRAMQELAQRPDRGEFAMEGANYLIEAMRHFAAPELVPAAERMVGELPLVAAVLVDALADFPDVVRGPALDRIFSNPGIAAQFAANPYMLRNLPFSEPRVVKNVAGLFSGGMTPRQQGRFLAEFGAGRDYTVKPDFFPEKAAAAKPGNPAADIKGRLDFLAQIEPAAAPEIRQQVAEAREELAAALENPVPEPADQVISIGNGAGDAVIKGRRIQSIRIDK